jgi:hypothetical protein
VKMGRKLTIGMRALRPNAMLSGTETEPTTKRDA